MGRPQEFQKIFCLNMLQQNQDQETRTLPYLTYIIFSNKSRKTFFGPYLLAEKVQVHAVKIGTFHEFYSDL